MSSISWDFNHKFDAESCRHFSNGKVSVLHCHHYATLYCQLADDAEQFNGKQLLIKACEISFLEVLSNYFKENNITKLEDRAALCADYWKKIGLGILEFTRLGPMSAEVVMSSSHVDRGWLLKWDKIDKAINFFGQGFIAAAMAAIYDENEGSYQVSENESIVRGSSDSRFIAVRA